MNFHSDKTLPADPNAIWVFGSNLSGAHGAGAAKVALERFGAVYGRSSGLVGSSYAIPTKGRLNHGLPVLPMNLIEHHIEHFVWFSLKHQNLSFFVTRVGCGLAGLEDSAIAPLFQQCKENCSFAQEWEPILATAPKRKFSFLM